MKDISAIATVFFMLVGLGVGFIGGQYKGEASVFRMLFKDKIECSIAFDGITKEDLPHE